MIKTEYRKIADLRELERNPRTISKKQFETLKKSLTDNKDYFEARPIILSNRTGELVIIAGNQRYKAAKALGMAEVPTVLLDGLSEEREREIIIRDNVANGEWDMDILANEWDTELLEEWGIEGMSNFADIDNIEEVDTPEVEEVAETDVKAGDIFQLGDHRLICGSCLDADDVGLLMDGEKAKMLFTSPPYADLREYNGDKELGVDDLARFIDICKDHTDYMCVNLGIIRRDGEVIPYWDEYTAQARASGMKMLAWNIWDKMHATSIGQMSAMFPLRHEWIFVFGKQPMVINKTVKKKAENISDGVSVAGHRNKDASVKHIEKNRSGIFKAMESVQKIEMFEVESVSEVEVEHGKITKEHPAVFPVKLPAEYIRAMTAEGDIVLEPFGGSGTTLMACEQLGRRCRIVELDPRYCRVIIKRWEEYTGRKVEKL